MNPTPFCFAAPAHELFVCFRYWRYEKHLENLATGIVADIPESQSAYKDDSDPYLDVIEETGLAKGVALQVRCRAFLYLDTRTDDYCYRSPPMGFWRGFSMRLSAMLLPLLLSCDSVSESTVKFLHTMRFSCCVPNPFFKQSLIAHAFCVDAFSGFYGNPYDSHRGRFHRFRNRLSRFV